MKLPDPRNADILVHVNGRLVPRADARVSVFDSVVQGGDAVWEGLRVYDGRIAALGDHLQRLQDSAKALAFAAVPTSESIRTALFETLKANGMRDETHIRLTLTRGEKITSGMNPRLNQSGCTLIVLAEWKRPVYSEAGIPVSTVLTVAGLSALLHLANAQYPTAAFMTLSGGLMLGAVFMATDMVGSPMTHLGAVIYGVLIGVLVVAIRVWGGMPEGVMYAILLGNAVTPLIDQQIQPRVYGTRRRKEGA